MKLFKRRFRRRGAKRPERVFLIVNPVSGKLKARNSFFEIIQTICQSTDKAPSVALTEHRGHATELAASAVKEGYDRIVCCGGDGTLNETINGVMQAKGKQKIGYIPAGSTNDFANGIGISADIEEAAQNAICGNDFTLDVGIFGENYHFCYIASFGIFTASSYSAPQQAKNLLGHFAYVLEGLKDLATIKTTHVCCEADGEVIEGDYIFGAVANTLRIGGIVKLDKETVKLNDGLFELLLVKKPNSIHELNKIATSVTNLEFDQDMVVFKKVESVKFTLPTDTVWSVDGEMKNTPESGEIDIRIAKRSVIITV